MLALWLMIVALSADASFVNFECKQTRPICLTPDGMHLLAVNTPDARLSVWRVDHPSHPFLVAEIPVGLGPVSVNARNNDEVWVVNEVSDSVSIVSLSQQLVVQTLAVKDEPADVVFAGGKAFVSSARRNELHVFDSTNRLLLATLTLQGENPRALAVSPDSAEVYAAFALSGNRTTLVPADVAPPQPTNATPPMKPGLPPPPQVSLIVDATDPAWTLPTTNVIQFSMPDNDVAVIDVSTLNITHYFKRVGTVNLGLTVHPVNGDLFVANTEALNLIQFEPNLRSHAVDNRISHIETGTGTVTPWDLNPGVNYATLPNPASLSNALAQPTAIVSHPNGEGLYVAAFGTDRVARVSTNGVVQAIIEVGPPGAGADSRNKRGPRGLALNAAANRLYVLNRLANTISVIDTGNDTVLNEIPVGSYDPTPDTVKLGRGFLYDAKLSGNGTLSCASCHVDAEMDMLAWDLGDPQGDLSTNTTVIPQLSLTNTSVFHPMKGAMVTQTLRGMNTLEPFHWRGDRTNFVHFNIAFPGLMGGPPLNSADMEAYRDFINTLVFQPNPNQNLDGTLPTTFAGADPLAGFTNFVVDNYVTGLSCNDCHTLPTGTSKLIIPAAILEQSQDIKVAHLRNMYQKTSHDRSPGAESISGFGFLHDGRFPDLVSLLSLPVFGSFATNDIIKSNLNAYLLCLDTGTAPAVGYTLTLTASNVLTTDVSNDWTLLESQMAVGANIDLIVKARLENRSQGFLYDAGSDTYLRDSTQSTALTRAQLVSAIQAGAVASLMGVPPGSGLRMGIDRDEDGVLDGDTPPPQLNISLSGTSAILDWPFSAVGYELMMSDSLNATSWTNSPEPVTLQDQRNRVIHPLSGAQRFFQLQQPQP